MADLDYTHADQVVALSDDSTGNLASVHSDGSIFTAPSQSGLVKEKNIYCVALEVLAASGNTDNPVVLLRNPSDSTKTVYIYLLHANTPVANVSATFRVFADPTVSANGTSQTAQSRYIGGGAATAQALVTTIPTITANGSQIANGVVGQNSSETQVIGEYTVGIAPNHAILITANPSSNNRNMEIELVWAEL